jgi:hypothetical protein
VDLVGSRRDALVRSTRDIAKETAQGMIGDDPHTDLVAYDDDGERRARCRVDEVFDGAGDLRLRIASQEEVREPERQAVDDGDVHVFEAAKRVRQEPRSLDRPERVASLGDVTRDAVAHLVVQGARGRHEGASRSELPRAGERERTLARPHAAADEHQMAHACLRRRHASTKPLAASGLEAQWA